MAEALASSYRDNPNLNGARAQLRSIDENVPKAMSGYRPQVQLQAQAGIQYNRSTLSPSWSKPLYPRGITLSVQQPIFLGFKTKNSVKMAMTAVYAAREQLKGVEQNVLLETVQSFMDVIQAQVVLNLRSQNVIFLQEQVKAANDRLNVGEGTRTDLAQANASLAAGRSAYASAVADLNKAIATYIQVVGHRPQRLGNVDGVHKLLPRSLDVAQSIALTGHPDILAAAYNVDVASYNVKIGEAAFLPQIGIEGSYTHRDDTSAVGQWSDTAALTGSITVPIYDRGENSAEVRQLKETLGQQQIELDGARDSVRQNVVSAWATLEATIAQVAAAASQVEAQQLALSGIIEERKVGQRTTLDVLNSQQDLLDARVSQVQAQHDRVVATYALVASVGKLTAKNLGLGVEIYDPTDHYNAVKDKWYGLRTPDGR